MDPTVPVIEAVLIIGGILYYIANRKVRNRSRNVRYSQMRLTDLQSTAIHLSAYEERANLTVMQGEDLPMDMYRGLVSSTNISCFETRMQEKLHLFYTMVRQYNREFGYESTRATDTARMTGQWDDMKPMVELMKSVTKCVKKFRDRNKLGKSRLVAAKVLQLAYDDE